MAITITWATKTINVPKADMTLIGTSPFEIRELNINTFRLALKDLEDDEAGINFPTTHNHNTTVTVGGVTLARVVEIINGYTITFEAGATPYAVNLVGANSNVADVTNLNHVQIRSANSTGLIQVATTGTDPTALATAVWAKLLEDGYSAQQLMQLMSSTLLGKVSGVGTSTETFRSAGDTANRVASTTDLAGNRTSVVLSP